MKYILPFTISLLLLSGVVMSQKLLSEKVTMLDRESLGAGVLSDGYYFNLALKSINCRTKEILICKGDSIYAKTDFSFANISKIIEKGNEINFYGIGFLLGPRDRKVIIQATFNKSNHSFKSEYFYIKYQPGHSDFFSKEASFDVYGKHIVLVDEDGIVYQGELSADFGDPEVILEQVLQLELNGIPVSTKFLEEPISEEYYYISHFTTEGASNFRRYFDDIQAFHYTDFHELIRAERLSTNRYILFEKDRILITSLGFTVLDSLEIDIPVPAKVGIQNQSIYFTRIQEIDSLSAPFTDILLEKVRLRVGEEAEIQQFHIKSGLKMYHTPLLRDSLLYLIGGFNSQHITEMYNLQNDQDERIPSTNLSVSNFSVTDIHLSSANSEYPNINFKLDVENTSTDTIRSIEGVYIIPNTPYCIFSRQKNFPIVLPPGGKMTLEWGISDKLTRQEEGDSLHFILPCFTFYPMYSGPDLLTSDNRICPGSVSILNPILSTYDISANPFAVWPTPFSSKLFIQSEEVYFNQMNVQDLNGRVLAKFDLNCQNGIIELSELAIPAGMYYLVAYSCDPNRPPMIQKVLKK